MSQVVSTEGNTTPFQVEPIQINREFLTRAKERIEAAKNAKAEEFTDTTPIYWEANKGDEIVVAFVGTKPMNKKDEAGNVVSVVDAPIFTDGQRPIIMGQIAAIEAAQSMQTGETYKILCTDATKKQAKKFIFLRYDG